MQRRSTLSIVSCAMLFVGAGSANARFQQRSLLDSSVPFENEWRITRAGHFDIAFTRESASRPRESRFRLPSDR